MTIRLEARLKSGSEWFATLREYKTEKAYKMAMEVLIESPKFEYRIEKTKKAPCTSVYQSWLG